MRAALLLWIAAVGVASGAAAQTRVAVRVEPQAVRVGETVTYTLTIEDGRTGFIDPPDATGGLDLLQRRPTSDRSSTVNGRTDRRVTWTYRATGPGTATLGAISFRAGALTFETDPVTVTVRAPGPSSVTPRSGGLPAEAVALRLQTDVREAVVGQQIVVEVVLYTDPDAQPVETRAAGAWNTPGVWREELDTPDPAVGRTVRDGGRERVAYVVERLAIFPTRPGTLTLAPRELRVALVRYAAPSLDPFDGWFTPFLQQRETVTVQTPPLTIEVSPPPAGAPPSFAGAVGDVTLERRVDRTSAAPDEPVTVTLTLRGDANLATLAAPDLGVPPDAADVFDPEEAREADRLGERLLGARTWTWTLVPTGGDITIPTLAWTSYDPSAGRYVTHTAPAATIRVAGGPATASGASPALVLRSTARRVPPAVPPGLLWGALAVGALVPALVVGGRTARRRWRERPRRAAPPRPPSEADEGYAGTEARVRRAVAARWGVDPATPPERLAGALIAAGADAATADRLAAVVAHAQRGRFAPGLGGTPAPAMLAAEATAALAASPAARAGAVAVLALLLLAPPASAQPGGRPDDPTDSFALGVQLAAEGDTAGAVAAWQAAGGPDADHNLGVVALSRGDAGRARLHLERAARAAPLDGATRLALAEARERTGAPAPTRTAQAWAVLTVGGSAPLVALAVALLLAATAAFATGRRRPATIVGGVGAVLALAAAISLVGAAVPRGVVVASAPVRAAPSPDAPEAGALPVGTAVRLGDREAGWREVHAEGVAGWLPERAVGR